MTINELIVEETTMVLFAASIEHPEWTPTAERVALMATKIIADRSPGLERQNPELRGCLYTVFLEVSTRFFANGGWERTN